MKKQKIYIFFLSFIIIFSAIADDVSVNTLKCRLKKVNNLYVFFIQKISNIDGDVLEESQGELWVKSPNLFFWHMQNPEEMFLISDGKTLWHYFPGIKQVVAYWVDNICIDNIFQVLLSHDDLSVWNNYHISQKGDCFFLKPMYNNNLYIKNYVIKITDSGIIEQFSFVEFDERFVHYYLSKHDNNEIDVSRFCFDIPKDVQLDDQRK